jgi:uncharacterized protein (TIGR03663 family)
MSDKPRSREASVWRDRRNRATITADSKLSSTTWRACCWATVAVGGILRLSQLSLKPLHHDEGVNGLFLVRLIREGIYRFDAANYHGPTLYYFALALARLRHLLGGPLDLGVTGLRITPAVFSIATIVLILQLRRRLGDRPTLFAAGLVAVSPGAVYFARDFIHESLLLFFTLALVVTLLQWLETQHALYLFLAAISGALLLATKETAIITLVVLLSAWFGSSFWMRARGGMEPVAASHDISPSWADLAMSLLLFAVLLILFFSSFFSNMQGIVDSIRALRIWGHTGLVSNRHPWYSYLLWLTKSETIIVVLGSVGFVFSLRPGCRRFEGFAALWAFGILGVYSLLPYKTPWLALNTVIPMGIVAGSGLEFIFVRVERALGRLPTSAIATLVLMSAIVPTYQCISLNWVRYDDESHPYVYSQTLRGFLSLVREIEESAHRFGTDKQTSITITSADYWPLPWYLRDYPKAGYYGHVVKPHEQIVLASSLQESVLLPLLDSDYVRVASYPLRPGVNLVCYLQEPTQNRHELMGH